MTKHELYLKHGGRKFPINMKAEILVCFNTVNNYNVNKISRNVREEFIKSIICEKFQLRIKSFVTVNVALNSSEAYLPNLTKTGWVSRRLRLFPSSFEKLTATKFISEDVWGSQYRTNSWLEAFKPEGKFKLLKFIKLWLFNV